MKRLFLIILCVGLLSGCVNNQDTDTDDLNADIEAKNEEIAVLSEKLSGLEAENEELKSKLENVERVYSNHYHYMEAVNDNVYMIMESGDSESDTLMRKLVKYSYDMMPHTIFESPGLDFRVSPNEEIIAIEHSEENDYRVSFFNGSGIIQFNMELDKFEEDLTPHLYGWSDDSRYFWGTMQHTFLVDSYFIVDTKDWSVKTIDNVKNYGKDMAINTNNGWLCYSDYPVCLDIQCREDFIESGKEVDLWLYNIFTEEFKRIAGSVTKEFNPVWTGENTLEYDAPVNDSRIRYIMDWDGADAGIHELSSHIVDFMYFDPDNGNKHFSENVDGWESADILNHWIGVLADKGISYGSTKNGENILSKLKVNSLVEESNLVTIDFNEAFLEFDNDETQPFPFIVCMNYIINQISDVGISDITNMDEVRIRVDGTHAIDLIQPDGSLKRDVFR